MTSETQVIFEEMEKFYNHMQTEWVLLLKNLSGNLKAIECGTHIRIPTAVGYVNYYKLPDSAKVSLWMSDELLESPKFKPEADDIVIN